MTDLAILVTVLARPQNVAPLVAAFNATVPGARIVFIADPDDSAEQEAIIKAEASMIVLDGGYAAKIRAGVLATESGLLFIGADDLAPHLGWFEAAKARMTDGVEVVGVNDLIERRPEKRGHATHFLVTREYAERPCIDGSPGPLAGCYDHSFVDDELIATASKRGVYAYAEDSHVRHDHPMSGAADDETYRKGRANFRQDRITFNGRAHLWT